MYHSKLVSVLLVISFVLNSCTGAALYPKSLQTQKGSASSVSISALQEQDQSGSQDSWNKYVEFYGSSTAYEGIFTFDTSSIDASSVGAYSLDVNFKGPKSSAQVWQFEYYEPASSSWVLAGDNSDAQSWKWTALSFCGSVEFASLVQNGNIQVRLSSTEGDDCDVDYLAITTTEAASSSTGSPSEPTAAPTSRPGTSAPTTRPTKAPTAEPTTRPTTAPTSKPTSRPTSAPTNPPTTTAKSTTAPTNKPTSRPTPAPTSKPTSKPTSAPTSKPTNPTTKPTSPPSAPGGRMCPAGQVWAPAPGTTWQWQLTGTLDQSVDVQMYDIDLFDNTAATIASLHSKGRAVVSFSICTQYEDWRPDASSFTSSVLGANLDDWPGERYVDIRSSVVRSIMQSRLDLAVSKGCDGVEPDNVDEYTNSNGLGITANDQLDFNKFMASEAHKRGLSVGLKNDLDQVKTLQPNYDWALNEQCNQYGECSDLSAFVNAGKAVFGVEYSGSASKFCPTMVSDKFSWLLKDLDLSAKVTECCTYASGGCAAKASYQCVNYNSKRSEVEEAEAIVEEVVATPANAEPTQEFDSAATSVAFPIVAVASLVVAALVL